MKTKLITLVAAAAMAVTGFASTPAQAGQNDDFVRFLVGVAVLGAIANSANQNSRVTVSSGGYAHQHNHLPRQCLRKRWTNNGWKKYYDRQCMHQRGWHVHGGQWHRHYY